MDNGKLVRKFSFAGPCLVQGKLVRGTEKFWVYREWLGGDRVGEPKRIAKDKAHVEPCTRCRDHAETVYPNGYMD